MNGIVGYRKWMLGLRMGDDATPVIIFVSTIPNQFIHREGEAPAELLRRAKLGRSLALQLFFTRLTQQTFISTFLTNSLAGRVRRVRPPL